MLLESLCQAQQSPLLPADGAVALRRGYVAAVSPAVMHPHLILQTREGQDSVHFFLGLDGGAA